MHREDGLLLIPFDMRGDKFKLYLLPSVALFPLTAVCLELTVTDFICRYNTTVGYIVNCNVKRCNILQSSVRGLSLQSFDLLLIEGYFGRWGYSTLCTPYGVATCTVLVHYILIVAILNACNTCNRYTADGCQMARL